MVHSKHQPRILEAGKSCVDLSVTGWSSFVSVLIHPLPTQTAFHFPPDKEHPESVRITQ